MRVNFRHWISFWARPAPAHRPSPVCYEVVCRRIAFRSQIGVIRSPITMAAWLLAAVAAPEMAGEARSTASVQQVDANFRKAMIAGDVEALKQAVADDAKIIHGNHGGIQTKNELIRDFLSYHIDRYNRTPVYSLVDRNTAVLVSVTHKRIGGRSFDTTTTEVLVRRGGRWQIVVLQNTDHGVS